jgi:hypothetical protein
VDLSRRLLLKSHPKMADREKLIGLNGKDVLKIYKIHVNRKSTYLLFMTFERVYFS